jgi:hypothetical protein
VPLDIQLSLRWTPRVTGRRCTRLKSRADFLEKSEGKVSTSSIDADSQQLSQRFFLKSGGKCVGEAAPPLYRFMKRKVGLIALPFFYAAMVEETAGDRIKDSRRQRTFPTTCTARLLTTGLSKGVPF